ncbi:MAG: peptide chain release factor-like protein [Chloroflexi bacterium]|nr:peptide chain release factor-like protein [Chloroflexota bacterium]
MQTDRDANQDETAGRRFATDLDTLRREVVVETYRPSGAGGQRRDKKETAIRLTHPPSGITVIASERRSQAMNLEVAFERLREKLIQLNQPRKQRVETKPSASALQKWEEEKKRQSQKKERRKKLGTSEELD